MKLPSGGTLAAATTMTGSGLAVIVVAGFVQLDDRVTYPLIGSVAVLAALGCLVLVLNFSGFFRLVPAIGLAACFPLFQTGLLAGPDPSSMDYLGFLVLGVVLLLTGLFSIGVHVSAMLSRQRA